MTGEVMIECEGLIKRFGHFTANRHHAGGRARPAESSRRLQFLLVRQFSQRAAHRFLSQARIGVHDFGNRHARREGLQNERHRNARAAHARASTQVLRVSDNPFLHTKQSNRFGRTLKEKGSIFGFLGPNGSGKYTVIRREFERLRGMKKGNRVWA